ncbi:MAG TPA: RNA polymerase sigma factor [Candidatus Baltobacteraceae bacterium]|jgi:RNA polymerase sigma-70 factor (ECF subfamily)|nr:RNA polymerase sigma factor [Candidatus Baltobacteraceae bacterium]
MTSSAGLESIYETESRHVLATLIRLLGDFELAEDALHEAFLAAAEQWPREGIPRNPRSWLISAGRFQAIDSVRRRVRYDASLKRLAQHLPVGEELNADFEYIADDDLRLIFLCCHPALNLDAQVALTLREACGLTTEEIAQAFVAKPSTIAQRIVRAKTKIRDAGIAYELPPPDEFTQRLQGVLHVIYLLFNEGYDASSGPSLLRVDLCGEAIRLTRLVAGVMGNDAVMGSDVCGLLALMLFHHSRRNARTDPSGELILLGDQDRAKWDRTEIAQAQEYLKRAASGGTMGRYAYEASIAQAHTQGRTPQETDWGTIIQLYDGLLKIEPSPIIELNRAAAISMRDGPSAGLALVEKIVNDNALSGYRFAHAARADMYRRLGRLEEAKSAYAQALALTQQEAERRYLTRRIAELDAKQPALAAHSNESNGSTEEHRQGDRTVRPSRADDP